MTREKRKYEKRDHDFWAVRKSLIIGNKKARIDEERKQVGLEYNPPQAEPGDTKFENIEHEQGSSIPNLKILSMNKAVLTSIDLCFEGVVGWCDGTG